MKTKDKEVSPTREARVIRFFETGVSWVASGDDAILAAKLMRETVRHNYDGSPTFTLLPKRMVGEVIKSLSYHGYEVARVYKPWLQPSVHYMLDRGKVRLRLRDRSVAVSTMESRRMAGGPIHSSHKVWVNGACVGEFDSERAAREAMAMIGRGAKVGVPPPCVADGLGRDRLMRGDAI